MRERENQNQSRDAKGNKTEDVGGGGGRDPFSSWSRSRQLRWALCSRHSNYFDRISQERGFPSTTPAAFFNQSTFL